MSYLKNYRWFMLLLVSVSLILVPGFTKDAAGKGKPACVSTDPVMISLATLDSWIESGKALEATKGFAHGYMNGGSDSCGLKKMAIISVQTGSGYASGHPTGAYLWDRQTELRTDRSDGIISVRANVATQPMMDVIMDRAGINRQTVVVLIGDNLMQTGLAYFNLRYWGVPKSQLRVANGLIRDFPGTLTTTVPVNTGDKDFGVCDLSQATSVDEVRASLAEMMNVASDSDPNSIVLDVRSSSEYNGTQARTDTAFSGRIKTAVWNEWKNQTTTGSHTASGSQIKDAASLTTIFNGMGITSADTSYIY